MSQAPGGQPLGTERIDFKLDSTQLEAGVAKAVETAKAGAAQAQAAVNSAAGGGAADGGGNAANEFVESTQNIKDAAKDAVAPLADLQKAARTTLAAFFGWSAVAGIVVGAVSAIHSSMKDLWGSLTSIGKEAADAGRKIEDPLIKNIEKLKSLKNVKVDLNVAELEAATKKLPELQKELDGLILKYESLDEVNRRLVASMYSETKTGADRELQDAARRWGEITKEMQRTYELQARVKQLQEQDEQNKRLEAQAITLALINSFTEGRIKAEEELGKVIEENQRKQTEKETKDREQKSKDIGEQVRKEIEAAKPELERIENERLERHRKIDEDIEQEQREWRKRELEEIKKNIDEAANHKSDKVRKKEAEDRAEREKKDKESNDRVAKQLLDSTQRTMNQIRDQAATLLPVDKLSVQLNEIGRLLSQVVSNTRNIE